MHFAGVASLEQEFPGKDIVETHKICFIITVMPKLVDHEERRRSIASAAVDAIASEGLAAVKLTDIARAAGVTTGAVAHYFSGKDAVLAAALDEVCTRLFAGIDAPDHALTLDAIAEVLPVTPEKRAEWRVWLAYWGRAPNVPALREIHQQYYDEIETATAETIAGRHPDPRRAAAAIIAAVDGIGVRVTLEPDLWPPERQRALLETLVGPLLASIQPQTA
ncbi:MAG: TetR/AcrR family transcriptional regulator [Pseudomonadota bacterium]